MPKQLIRERIIHTAEVDLSAADISRLRIEKNRQVRFLVISYMPLALILAYVFVSGPGILEGGSTEPGEEEINNFAIAAPYTCGGFLILLTIFFLRYYLQTAGRLARDLSKNKKLLFTIPVEKTAMPYFEKYYITTPLRQKQQLQLQKEDFDKIKADGNLIIEVAPYSGTILGATSDGVSLKLGE